MATKPRAPAITATAFECPHCNAYTTQYWYELSGSQLPGGANSPRLVDDEVLANIKKKKAGEDALDPKLVKFFEKLATQVICLYRESKYRDFIIGNLHLSRCYECSQSAVWIYRTLVYPTAKQGEAAHPDLPLDIQADYEEARSISTISPRGAAALLRLCIQKLCKHLGGTGADINADIAKLVGEGLSPTVQKALDIVRVVGNEAVHPGVMDLKDDSEIASRLFSLVNLIVEQMIATPAHISEIYGKLPEGKRKAIEERDAKNKKQPEKPKL